MDSKAVGIDLGTTFSCVAVYKNGRATIIPNNFSNRMTPSCVAFTSDGIVLVGEAAKDQQARNATNTVFAVKRLIGRRFSDKSVKKEIKSWPFKVVADVDDKPVIQVELGGQSKRYSPEAISAEVLIHMKKLAEGFLGHPVADAVITIPANFGDAQRQSTCEAARLAGISVLRLLNEPTAAAVAYGFENVTSVTSTKNILVFDLGGGTLDVSILSVSKESLFEVKATAGNMHLGGEDFDNILVNHFADEFKRKNKSNLLLDKKAVRRLSAACERTKRSLSQNLIGTVEIDCLHKGRDFQGKMDRAEFDALCGELFLKAMLPVAEALRNAKLIKADVHEIVLSGGSSRIPMVRKLLRDYFDGKQLNERIDPEEAVAYGAAIMAAKLSGIETCANIRNMKLVDIASQSLGIENSDGYMVVEIPQGTRLPCKRTDLDWITAFDNQTDIDVCIYEGEHKKAKRNTYLGCFGLVDLPSKPKGEVTVDKTMEIDENGILHVSAVERSTGKANQISFSRRFGLSHGI